MLAFLLVCLKPANIQKHIFYDGNMEINLTLLSFDAGPLLQTGAIVLVRKIEFYITTAESFTHTNTHSTFSCNC